MKLKIAVLAALAVLVLAGSAPATKVFFYGGQYQPDYGLDLNWLGSSARARAMGGAFISIVDDASAVTWNPAGLIQSLDPQISFSGVYLNPKTTFEISSPGGTDYALDKNVWTVDYAAFLAPITMREHEFSLSAAYQRLDHLSAAQLLTWEDSVATAKVYTYSEQYITGSLDVANLGFGTNIYGNLAFGAAANIYFGSAEETSAMLQEAKGSGWTNLWQDFEGKSLWRAHFLSEVSYSGFNVTIGTHYKSETFSVGAVARTPFNLIREFDITLGDTTYLAEIDAVYRPIDVQPLFIVGDRKEKIEIPLTLAAGVSVSITPNFLISMDGEWRRFGKSNFSVLDSGLIKSSGEKEEFFTETSLNFNNGGEARFGFEYLFEGATGIVPIRGGLRYVQHYMRDIHYDSLYAADDNNNMMTITTYERAGDKITGYGFSAGTGIHWERIWLDLAFEYYTDNRNVTYPDMQMEERFDAEEAYKRTRIALNFTGFF